MSNEISSTFNLKFKTSSPKTSQTDLHFMQIYRITTAPSRTRNCADSSRICWSWSKRWGQPEEKDSGRNVPAASKADKHSTDPLSAGQREQFRYFPPQWVHCICADSGTVLITRRSTLLAGSRWRGDFHAPAVLAPAPFPYPAIDTSPLHTFKLWSAVNRISSRIPVRFQTFPKMPGEKRLPRAARNSGSSARQMSWMCSTSGHFIDLLTNSLLLRRLPRCGTGLRRRRPARVPGHDPPRMRL